MKMQLIILLVLVILLPASSAVGGQSAIASLWDFTDNTVMMSGGNYHLAGLASTVAQCTAWQVNGGVSGGLYRLVALPSIPLSSENGCCCVYLPTIMR